MSTDELWEVVEAQTTTEMGPGMHRIRGYMRPLLRELASRREQPMNDNPNVDERLRVVEHEARMRVLDLQQQAAQYELDYWAFKAGELEGVGDGVPEICTDDLLAVLAPYDL